MCEISRYYFAICYFVMSVRDITEMIECARVRVCLRTNVSVCEILVSVRVCARYDGDA